MASTPSSQPSHLTNNGVLILWGCVDPNTVDEEALNDWWTNEHLPERIRLPGFRQAHRYRALERKHGKNEYLALYEASDTEDLASEEYLHALNNPTERTVQFMPCLARMNRFACNKIWFKHSPVSISDQRSKTPNLLFLVVYHCDDSAAGLGHAPVRLIREHLEKRHPDHVDSTQILEVNPHITRAGSSSKSYDGVQFFQFDSADGGNATKTANKFIALFYIADGSATGNPLDSEWLDHVANSLGSTGIHVEFVNSYELIASLRESSIAC
ncbi:hypothetical protein BDW02DRAFT_507694 [Decorospora gaudefroyi]|uniref:ABM domain-containing protein n=1 Tax=Decorospora gaudefroyi TaxID=184978 RepID=A0A6A5K0E9_9PLEO|nr:hypothetical protein BDW02DRAFT_507694 [Decorospora gaudefroyi]